MPHCISYPYIKTTQTVLKNCEKIHNLHTTFWKSITKVTPFSNEGPILHQDALSFHLSHQPPLYVSIHFSLHELVQLVLILLSKIKSTRTRLFFVQNPKTQFGILKNPFLSQKHSSKMAKNSVFP